MFRKPKNKVALRQRTSGWDDGDVEGSNSTAANQEVEQKKDVTIKEVEGDDVELLLSKPPALLSFDHDEGADADFTVRKNRKKVKELKRLGKLEEEAAARDKIEKEREEKRKEKEENDRERQNQRDKERKEKDRYLDKYRDHSSSTYVRLPDSDDEVDIDLQQKFPSTFGGIPDSRAVYEAKKRRERLRREGTDGYPVDDDQKLKSKGTRERLVREDDNDDSDEDSAKFYSSKSLVRNEEDRRRDEQNEFLAQEQGDVDRDDEADAWEKQQILKAVSRHTIGQIRTEYDNSARLFKERYQDENKVPEDIDMDIDMDIIVEDYKFKNSGPSNTGGHVTIEDILAKLKLRMNDRIEALNARRDEVKKMENHLNDNKAAVLQMEGDVPTLSNKYAMFQEMRIYCRSLLDCLNEKVTEINELGDKRRNLAKARAERLARRRRRDTLDAYNECSTAAAGKNPNTIRIGDAGIRASEREARRARRRRDRENTLAGISHEDGLSSDDEETTSQQVADNQAKAEVDSALSLVFVDALDDYAQLRKVLDRMVDWLAVDSQSFEDAYVYLCIPKLASPYVRLQLITADILNQPNFILSGMQWYVDGVSAGSNHPEINSENEIIVGIVPLIVEKVVLPFFTDLVNEEWDPMSLKQTMRLGAVLNGLTIYPTMTEKSKPLTTLLAAVKRKITIAIDEDLFVPMYSKQAIKNTSTGCGAFLDRQYWSAIKLLRGLNYFSSFLSPQSRFELAVEGVINRVCVVALQIGILDDVACERKVRALMAELPESFITMDSSNSFRLLIACLNKVVDEQKAAGRDFYRDVRKFVEKLQKN